MPSKRILWTVFLLYCAFIFYGTAIPFEVNLNQVPVKWHQFLSDPLISEDISLSDLLSNFLLFIPFGILLAALFQRITSVQASWICVILFTALVVVCFSTTIEICQLMIPSRTTSLVDILTDTAGGICGAIASLTFFKSVYRRVELFVKSQLAREPIAFLLMIFAACQLIGALFPFDVSIDVADLKNRLKTANFSMLAYHPWVKLPDHFFSMADFSENLILYALFGFTLAVCHYRYWQSKAIPAAKILCAGLLLPALVESLKLFITSRNIDMNHVVSAWLGIFMGVFLCAAISSRDVAAGWSQAQHLRQLRLWMFLYVLMLLVSSLNPFVFSFPNRSIVSRIEWLPFGSYYSNISFWALKDFLGTIFEAIPLGLYVGYRFKNSTRTKITVATTIAGLCIGILLEAAQIFVESRYPSITDMISYGTGSFLGGAGIVYYRRIENELPLFDPNASDQRR